MTISSEDLNKRTILAASDIGAVCNDGTPGIYYLHHKKDSLKWIIYVEGGGGCASTKECEERYKRTPYFMSSKSYPDRIKTRSLMSAEIYADYSKIIIPYCSSDLWLGNSSQQNNKLINSTNVTPYLFRGAVIFESVINEAIAIGLNKSTYVTIAGTSAGGIGAINHAKELQKKLKNTQLSIILDSSWFLNFDHYFSSRSNKEFLRQSGIARHTSCRDVRWGYPCCFSVSCSLSQSYIPASVEILVISSKYDVYILFDRLLSRDRTSNYANIFKTKEILTRVHAYGGHMLHSLEIVQSYPNFHYVLLSCFQHGYIASSSLWETVYNAKVELNFDSVHFEHTVSDNNLKLISVKGQSLENVVLKWHDILQNKANKSRDDISNLRITDSCLHAQCNPTCPQVIHFNIYKSGWENWKRVLLIFIILFIFAGCLVTKIAWMIQHHQLKTTQALYLCSNYDSIEGLDKIKCLPTCPPHSSVGISCTMLEYDIVNQSQAEIIGTLKRAEPAMRQRRLSLTHIRRKSFHSPGKKIISGITAYFNPGQLVAIMGPSGSGKTTLLDLLTARKHNKEAEDNIFINGLPAEETRDWFIKNSGYVLQLATPYHEELTVRQNLTYTAMMRLPMKMKVQDKMWRVEQVLGQCGLFDVADVVVGGNDGGGGLSGGQKRRLCIALQLLDLPSVIFLDEPTSGLDSASSLELLEALHGLTLSGRLVVVTIHQPRLEIFHMFDAILILSHGEVAYFGSPIVAPMMIAEALQDSGQVFDASNPADTIMDVLTNDGSQKIIVKHYQESGEIEAITKAIARARRHPQKTLSMKFQKQTSSIQNRLLALDGRSSASQTLSQKLYFTIIFLLYSLSLGSCYWKTEQGILLMSCYMVFSCASQLFMASVIHAHLGKAFALFALEKADGVGYSHELVLHVFIRVFSQAALPLIAACGIIYVCMFNEYVLWKFCITTLIHLQLNQTWIAIVILTACITPRYSPLVSPLLSAVAGFAGGFLVPEPQMPIFYYWLFYINPTHWAYRGIAKTLISDISFKCKWNSPLECQGSRGIMVLEEFGFHRVNPYLSMAVLLLMLCVLLIAAVIVLEVKYSKRQWKQVKTNYIQACKSGFSSLCGCWRACAEAKKRRKQLEEEERQRLFKLAEEAYTYKKEDEATNNDQKNDSNEDDEDDETKDVETSPKILGKDSRARSQSFTDAETVDSYNSSNDEDEDPTLQKERENLALPKSTVQISITSFLNKLQTSVSSGLSKSRSNTASVNSINTASNSSNSDPVRMRSRSAGKNKKWKTMISHRRQTFTGVIEENEELELPSRMRPKSLLIPKNNSDRSSPDLKKSFLEERQKFTADLESESKSSASKEVENTVQNTKNNKTRQNVPHIIHRPIPPDIIIDIESSHEVARGKEDNQLEATLNNNNIDNATDRLFSSGTDTEKVAKKQKKKKKKRQRDRKTKSKDTWSKYLDTSSQRHEVYCALNSIKKRLSGKERVKGKAQTKKQSSINIQRKASMQILDDKRRSLRDQLTGLRYSTANADLSPEMRKKINIIRARNKYRKPSEREIPNAVSFSTTLREQNNDNDFRLSTTSSKRTSKPDDERELLERLSVLSSQRNSRNSGVLSGVKNSRNDHSKSSEHVYENLSRTEGVTTEINDVLKKLNSLDNLDCSYSNFDSDFMENESRRRYLSYPPDANNRKSDPLLPEERELVEQLLRKYSQLYDQSPQKDGLPQNEKPTFSTKVKIKGTSPGHSRRSSVDHTKPATQYRASVNMDHVLEEALEEGEKMSSNLEGGNKTSSPQERSKQFKLMHRRHSEERGPTKKDILEAFRGGRNRSTSMTTAGNQQEVADTTPVRSSSGNKISNAEKNAKIIVPNRNTDNDDDGEEKDDDDDDDEDDDVDDEDKSKKSSVQEEADNVFDHSESSSEYEEEIVKTQEGFIIPKESIHKVMGNGMSPLAVGMRLRRESRTKEEEIERQFKRENFLKDRPARRGIRMPIGSAGKVNLLKSKFESKTTIESNSTRIRRSIENLNQKASSKTHRPFFKLLRSKSTQNSESGSDSEITGVTTPVNNAAIETRMGKLFQRIPTKERNELNDVIITERDMNFQKYENIGERHICVLPTPIQYEYNEPIRSSSPIEYDLDRSNCHTIRPPSKKVPYREEEEIFHRFDYFMDEDYKELRDSFRDVLT